MMDNAHGYPFSNAPLCSSHLPECPVLLLPSGGKVWEKKGWSKLEAEAGARGGSRDGMEFPAKEALKDKSPEMFGAGCWWPRCEVCHRASCQPQLLLDGALGGIPAPASRRDPSRCGRFPWTGMSQPRTGR